MIAKLCAARAEAGSTAASRDAAEATGRRSSLAMVGGVLLAVTLPVTAQPAAKMRRIGWFGNTPTVPDTAFLAEAFREGLKELGYVDGISVTVEYRFGQGNVASYRALAEELAALRVDVVCVSAGPPAVRAIQAAGASIPVVMVGIADPVGQGLVTNLAHPGGNVTGVAELTLDLVPKQFQIIREALPRASRVVTVSGKFGTFGHSDRAELFAKREAAAKAMGFSHVRIEMNSPEDLDGATAAVLRERPDALLLIATPLNFVLRRELAAFALRQRLPLVASTRTNVAAGALLSYGNDNADLFRKAGRYAGKILSGARPADLPVEQAERTELVINLKTAKALGITIPQSLLLRADEVIQ